MLTELKTFVSPQTLYALIGTHCDHPHLYAFVNVADRSPSKRDWSSKKETVYLCSMKSQQKPMKMWQISSTILPNIWSLSTVIRKSRKILKCLLPLKINELAGRSRRLCWLRRSWHIKKRNAVNFGRIMSKPWIRSATFRQK